MITRSRSRSSSINKNRTQRSFGDDSITLTNSPHKPSIEHFTIEDIYSPVSKYNQVTPESSVAIKPKLDHSNLDHIDLPLLPSLNDDPTLNNDLSIIPEHPKLLQRLSSDAWPDFDRKDPHLSSKIALNKDLMDNLFDHENVQGLFSHMSLNQHQISDPVVQNKENSYFISTTIPSVHDIPQSRPSSASSSSSATPPPTPSQSHQGYTNGPVITVTDEDVLLGRGGLTNSHRGNEAFRAFVEETKPMYSSYKTKAQKKEISLLVVEHIEQKGGRFLKNIKKSPDDDDKWVVAERGEARRKASQALREKRKKKPQNK